MRARRAAARPQSLDSIRRGRRTTAAPSLLLVGHGTAAGGRGRAAPDQAPFDPRGHGLSQVRVCRAHRSVAVQPVRDGLVRRLLPPKELGLSTGRGLGQSVHIPVDRPVHVPIFRYHHDGGLHRETGELIIVIEVDIRELVGFARPPKKKSTLHFSMNEKITVMLFTQLVNIYYNLSLS